MTQPHNSESNAGVEWGTPPKYVLPLAKTIDGFDLDPASGAEPKPYAENRFTKEDNGLMKEWFGHVWLNPPYGRKENPKWAEKAHKEAFNAESITALVPASTSTNWWQDRYGKADVFCFVNGRIEFIGAGDNGASFANVICVFNAENLPESYFDELNKMGSVMKNYNKESKSLFDY
jgi:phage N-6-adenine-methyltransferase